LSFKLNAQNPKILRSLSLANYFYLKYKYGDYFKENLSYFLNFPPRRRWNSLGRWSSQEDWIELYRTDFDANLQISSGKQRNLEGFPEDI
jgi:hypothetical protein